MLGVALEEVVVDRVLGFVDAGMAPESDAICGDLGPKKRSTRFIQDALVGVQCSLKRGCFPSQACTSDAGQSGEGMVTGV